MDDESTVTRSKKINKCFQSVKLKKTFSILMFLTVNDIVNSLAQSITDVYV